jgi:hypothetical protein
VALDKIAIACGLVPRSSAQVLQALREARNNTQYPDDIIAVDKATVVDGIEAAESTSPTLHHTRAKALHNLAAKLADPGFVTDIGSLVVDMPTGYTPHDAGELARNIEIRMPLKSAS